MPRLVDGLPAIYERLLPRFFTEQVPAEAKADCANCPMCAPSTPHPQRFLPETKCCTYHPKLPNYLVGGLLSDPDPALDEGRARIRARIARRQAVSPQWVRTPPKYDVLYKSSRDTFGRAVTLRCPFYVEEGGLCSIWSHREAVCSTFFCRHVGGADGHSLWMSFKRYLSLCEIQLSRFALLQLHPEWVLRQGEATSSPPPLDAAAVDERDGDELAHLEDWGDWFGREEELYVACHDIVRGLNADDVARILGLDGLVHRALLERQRLAVVEPTLPQRPRLNPHLTVRHLADGMVALGFYSEYDAIAIPDEAWRLLAEFRGEEGMSTVRERLREKYRSDLSDEVFVELHRHRVLI